MKATKARGATATDRHSARVRAAVAGGLVALIVMLVLAVQNTSTAGVHFLVWSWTGTPLFAVIVVSLLVGFGLGLLFMVSQGEQGRGRRPRRARAPQEAPPPPTATSPPPPPR